MNPFYSLTGLLGALLLSVPLALAATPAGTPPPEVPAALAQRIFSAWQCGEQTGDYAAFKAFLGPKFQQFSHPLTGVVTGLPGLAKLRELVAGREKEPNQLTFSRVEVTSSATLFTFHFDSAGTVAGGMAYAGFNVISLRIEQGQLTGFREYFGYVNPAWFQK
ncbi:hypothetical protein [Hymenobacter arizonensis]|uniref:SnoaL-like domain-containing protein n=1 Tax=Hymenobacter arizonensis TaxID=1227077 RepID=A0A1I6BJU8_HYMAR|nr:hypothetical protein [Hymenobacter arizonensis]SFQ81205.1 hypothetical protein SAMN04515668_4633 [Hymenobacter arizonensis]